MYFRFTGIRCSTGLAILLVFLVGHLGHGSATTLHLGDISKSLFLKTETSTESLASLAITEIIKKAEVSHLNVISKQKEGRISDIVFKNVWLDAALSYRHFSDLNAWKDSIDVEFSYITPATTIVIGNSDHLLKTTEMIYQLYKENFVNIKKTRWIYFVTEFTDVSTNMSRGDGPTSLSPQGQRFKKYTGEVSRLAFGGMKVVVGDLSGESEWVRIASADYNAQEWQINYCGSFSLRRGLSLLRPLLPPRIRNFNGRTFRITCLQKTSVFIFDEANPTLEGSTGYASAITKIIVEKLNMSTVLVPTRGFGGWNGERWTGMVGEIVEDRADIAPLDFSPSLQRSTVVQFAYFVGVDPSVLYSQAPSVVPRPFLLLQIYNYQVWSFIGVGLVAYALMMLGLVQIETYLIDGQTSHSTGARSPRGFEMVMFVIRQFLFQSSPFLPKTLAARILTCFMFLTTLVVNYTYQGSITAFLALPIRSTPINSLHDLVKSSAIPVLKKNSGNQMFFAEQESGILYDVNQRAQLLSLSEMSSWKYLREVAEGKYAFIDTISSQIGRGMLFEKQGKECMFHVGTEPISTNLDAFAYAKNSLLEEPVDDVIRWMNNYGINEAIKRKYFTLPCTKQKKLAKKTLTLLQIQGAFYVYVIAIIFSSAIFLGEHLFYKIFSKK